MLHCVQSAASGGENALMDHEVAYILLRDENPDYIRAFMQPDAMTIPPRMDEKGETARRVETGPVFFRLRRAVICTCATACASAT